MPDTAAARFYLDRMTSPVGELSIVADEAGALRVLGWFEGAQGSLERLLPRASVLEMRRDPHGLATALEAYFAGDLAAIDALPAAAAGTAFQRAVWKALREIPCGSTVSYSALAARLGKPESVRAVAQANGANPVAIVVPCHRVIGANGSLTGYGGGLERKRWLLEHEGALRSARLF